MTVLEAVSKDVGLNGTDLHSYPNGELVSLIDSSEPHENTDVLPTKKLKLDFETILMGEKPSDIHINAAQRFLKSEFLREWFRINTLSNEGKTFDRGFNQKQNSGCTYVHCCRYTSTKDDSEDERNTMTQWMSLHRNNSFTNLTKLYLCCVKNLEPYS